tara:strand:+ start:197 stop:1537 length:1341 start_codon:yes stop_codon:yes gene_type:complete
MAKSVKLTPASGKIEFNGTAGVLGFTISADTSGNMVITDGSGIKFFHANTSGGEVIINGAKFIVNGGTVIPVFSVTGNVSNPEQGMLIYNSSDDNIYRYTGTQWLVSLASEVITSVITKTDNSVLIDSSSPIVVNDMTLTPSSSGTYLVNFNSQFTVDDTSSETLQAKTDLIVLYNELMALPSTESGHVPTYGSETLGPGVYTQVGATNVTGVLTLDAGGDSTELFVFRCTGAFTTGASAEVVLTGGTLSSNVWFVAEGASSTGASTIFRGSIISNQAAVSTGAFTSIEGRMFAITGAVGIGDTSVFTEPSGTSESTLGILTSFNLFTGTGNVTNTGPSNIALSIGTNAGTITGFGTATVGGSIIPGGASSISIFSCGVYVDGVVVEDSLRSTSKPFEAETFGFPIILQSVATITSGQTIDIRGYSSLGEQTIGPRMSLVIIPITT